MILLLRYVTDQPRIIGMAKPLQGCTFPRAGHSGTSGGGQDGPWGRPGVPGARGGAPAAHAAHRGFPRRRPDHAQRAFPLPAPAAGGAPRAVRVQVRLARQLGVQVSAPLPTQASASHNVAMAFSGKFPVMGEREQLRLYFIAQLLVVHHQPASVVITANTTIYTCWRWWLPWLWPPLGASTGPG